MKKKLSIFLCVFAALFFGSCSDLSVDDEAALKADLPADFDWQVYGEINSDVMMSKIVLDLRQTKRGPDSIANCVGVLSNISFAEEIFSKYLQCPVGGWEQQDECPGIYANNSNYNKPGLTLIPKFVCPTITDDEGKPLPPDAPEYDNCDKDSLILVQEQASCVIGACFLGGWGGTKGLVNFLQDSLAQYLATSRTNLGVITAMCQFVPENSTPASAKEYLDEFKPDSVLVITHYKSYGRNDGRPYKYCNGNKGEERDQEKHADKRGNYYDYGRYTFCLDDNDKKIYVAQ